LETINYNNVHIVIYWAQLFITVATINFTFSFIKSLVFREVLFAGTYLIKYQQSIVKLIIANSKISF